MPPRMSIDIETRSECDLKKCGVYKYALDGSTICLCVAYKIDDKKVKLFIPGEDDIPADFLSHWNDPECELWAFNATFERCLFSKVICPDLQMPDVPKERWFCSMVLCYWWNITGGLDSCAKALGLDDRKDKKGHRIMLQLSKLRKPSEENPDRWFTKEKYPEKYTALYSYCKQDVCVESSIRDQLEPLAPIERELYLLDCKINGRGLYIDLPVCNAALIIVKRYKAKLVDECEKLCGFAPTQVAKLQEWFASKGVALESLSAENVRNALEEDPSAEDACLDETTTRVLELRQESSKTSVTKFQAMKNAACSDKRVHGSLQYYGASTTGRWAGRLIQPQNLTRFTKEGLNYSALFNKLPTMSPDKFVASCLSRDESPIDVLSTAIRGVIKAPPKKDMFIADYSGIEARVIAWLAEEDHALNIFRDDLCLYKDMAGIIYGIADPQKLDDKDNRRYVGKQAILSLGYGVGWKKFMNTTNEGMDYLIKAGETEPMSMADSQEIVKLYRTKYHNICKFWYQINDAVLFTIKTKEVCVIGKLRVWFDGFWLNMELPSGRPLRYPACHIKQVEKWEPGKFVPEIRYRGHKTGAKDKREMEDPEYDMSWRIIPMYGAKFIQNACQAIARDIMAEAMLRAESAGFQIILTVHDEIVSVVPQGTKTVDELCKVMCQVPVWCKGLPLAVDGDKVERYCK